MLLRKEVDKVRIMEEMKRDSGLAPISNWISWESNGVHVGLGENPNASSHRGGKESLDFRCFAILLRLRHERVEVSLYRCFDYDVLVSS